MTQPAPSSPTVASAKQAPGVVDALDADYRIIDTDRLGCAHWPVPSSWWRPIGRQAFAAARSAARRACLGAFIAAILGGRRFLHTGNRQQSWGALLDGPHAPR